MDDRPFYNNVVILTGASTGIGRAMALQLAEQGAWLMLAARNTAALKEVSAECVKRGEQAGARTEVQWTDVASQDECRTLIEQTIMRFGRIDTLVSNAGISMWARFEDMTTLAPFHDLMRVNYLGMVYLLFYALPHLKRTRGRIVGVSSAAGKNGVPTRTGYAASKHAMVGFLDSLRIELEGTGVTVTTIFPDFVTSEIRERAFGPDGQPLGKGNSPVQEGKVMSAEECARIAIRGMAQRKRDVLMSTRSKIGLWLKLIAPGMVDNIARRAIERGR